MNSHNRHSLVIVGLVVWTVVILAIILSAVV